jgi:hypothetical protein
MRAVRLRAREAWGAGRLRAALYTRSSRDLGGKKAKSPLGLRSSRLMPGISPIASLCRKDNSLRAIALEPSFHVGSCRCRRPVW